MYKVIIADDEDNIREGLSTIINWKELGFEVVCICSDGDQVLNYLKQNGAADVLLTDVRMTDVSGLDLAEYIINQRPAMKVVILSGYREFEYARTAAKYNVRHYLLKPTKLSEINKTFTEIRRELDDSKMSKNQQTLDYNSLMDMLSLYCEKLYTTGGHTVLWAKMARTLSALGYPPEDSCCTIFTVLCEFNSVNMDWKNIKNSILRSYDQLNLNENRRIIYVPISERQSLINYAAIYEKGYKTSEKDILHSFKSIAHHMKQILDIEIEMEIRKQCWELKEGFEQLAHRQTEECSDVDIENFQYNITKSINKGNTWELPIIFDKAIDNLQSNSSRINMIIELLNIFRRSLESVGVSSLPVFDYAGLIQCINLEEQRFWVQNTVNHLVSQLDTYQSNKDSRVIAKAKEYIEDNFNRNLSLKEVADQVYLSPTYFSRVFKQHTGMKFSDYLQKNRMEKAKVLLLEGCYKVYEVSEMVGYRNHKYFFQIFKDYTGTTPLEFSKMSFAAKEDINE